MEAPATDDANPPRSEARPAGKGPPRDDPRTHVTPDAFRIDADLLGQVLATPWRRASALMIDLVSVALLSSLGIGALTIAVGAFLVRFGRKRARRPASRLGSALGGVALVLLGLAGLFSRPLFEFGNASPAAGTTETVTGGDLIGLLAAEPGEVREAAKRLAESLQAAGGNREDAESALADLAARMAVGAEREQWIREGFAAGFAPVAAVPAATDPAEHGLRAELAKLAEDNEELRRREHELSAQVEAERNKPVSILARARAVAEDIGITFFWSTLYFTTFIGLFRGRTPGKRLLGLRVVRLDGGRLSVWNAFERHGGYLAGTATGLLGFLQVFWDPNRQAIQDKIAGTVVIREGQPKIRDLA